jgi:uncharacterized protein (DUF4415 family)
MMQNDHSRARIAAGATGTPTSLPNRTCYRSAMSRRPTYDPRTAAEKAFKVATTKPVEAPPKAPPSPPGAKEMVSLRIDRDVLDFFQEDGAGWQDRINAALRKAAGK